MIQNILEEQLKKGRSLVIDKPKSESEKPIRLPRKETKNVYQSDKRNVFSFLL